MNIRDFFSKADTVWVKNRENEKNLTIVFKANCPKSNKAILKVTGSSYYNVYINGKFAAVGPARAAHGYFRVDELPIILDKEENEIKIIVFGYAVNSFYHLDQPSFLCAEVSNENGIIAYTDAAQTSFNASEWYGKIQKVQRYSFQRPFAEVYDFTIDQYGKVILENTKEDKFLPRGIFYGKYEKENALQIIQKGTFTVSEKQNYYDDRSISNIGEQLKGYCRNELDVLSTKEAEMLTPVITDKSVECTDSVTLTDCSFATFDMGKNLTGLIGFNAEINGEGELYIVFDEIMQGDNINFTRLTTASVVIIKAKTGKFSFLSAEPYTYRYIRIYSKNMKCTVNNLHLLRVGAPEVKKVLDSDNKKLQAIYNAAIETYRQNTFDIYMDCPSRERAGWLCDSFFTSRVEKALTGKSEVEHNFLENYILPESFKCLPEGMLPMCYPADHYDGVYIPNWAMWFVVELREYLDRTGDYDFILKAKDKVYALLKFLKGFENEFGLLEKLKSWVFIEWSKSNDLVQDVSFPSNMLYAKVKRITAELYNDDTLKEEAEKLQQTIRDMSYTEKGFFCDNAYRINGKLELSGQYTESCQYYAFHTGVATPETHSKLWNCLINEFGFERKKTGAWPEIHFANAFIGNYLRLDLIAQYGDKDELLSNIEGYFYYMAEKTGTLWEIDSDSASCNHGFASHVAYWFEQLGMLREVD